MIKIARDLSLPLELATESTAILARKRAGKSYLARLITEQLLKSRIQTVVIDPKGDWWGVRSSSDGTGPGFPIAILGGEHGDVPIEPGASELTAKFVVENRLSVLIDLSDFRKHEVAKFMAGFLETLYRLKAKEENRTPMTLVIDEADAIAPQNPKGSKQQGVWDDGPRMLGAAEDIVRRGGQRGIGIVLVTQRAAVLNKNVLTQASVLMLLCTTGSQDIDAVDEWIKKHGQPDERAEVMSSIASLQRGECWVWAPGWPDEKGIFQRVKVGQITTFDSGATPKIGEVKAKPKTVAEVDLELFRKSMAATIEKAKADDPKLLKKEIAELKGQIARNVTTPTTVKVVDQEAVDQAVIDAVQPLNAKIDKYEFLFEEVSELLDRVKGLFDTELLLAKHAAKTRQAPKPLRSPPSPTQEKKAPILRQTDEYAKANGSVSNAQSKVLGALAFMETVGIPACSRNQLAAVVGLSPKASTLGVYLSELSRNGYVECPPGLVRLTEKGRATAPPPPDIRSLSELHDEWLSKFSKSVSGVLRVLLDRHPDGISRNELADILGLSRTASTLGVYISELTKRGIAESVGGGIVRANDVLFPEGLK